MKSSQTLLLALVLALAPGALIFPVHGGTKPVMVYYMPWFVAKPCSGSATVNSATARNS